MPVPLSLRPSWKGSEDREPLFNVLQKIYTERGHLRDITEESLKAEIEEHAVESPSSSISDNEDQKEEAPAQDLESRAKQVQSARIEMLQLISQANNEVLTALDFVSLLLSKDAPRQAEASMSPALKSMAPTGTLGYEKTESSSLARTDEAHETSLSFGFNLDSLQSSASKLLESATRLEHEIDRETKYWEQILSLSENGWSLCRLPGQPHTVAIRYGFPEASSSFRARGLAALRSDQDGNIKLDRGANDEPKSLRVRIMDADQVIEMSQDGLSQPSEDQTLHTAVHTARDSLFDEELFFQLLLNARDLFSYGVRIVNDQIILPFRTASRPKQKIMIDLVSRSSIIPNSDSLADSLALALRLSLSNLYRDRHRLRSLPPPPLNTEKRKTSISNLLLPFLTHIQHHAHATSLHSSLLALKKTLQSAKLHCNLEVKQEFVAQIVSENPKSDRKQATSTVEGIARALNGAIATTIDFESPHSTKLSIRITTDLSPSVCGTEYLLHQDQGLSFSDSQDMLFTNRRELLQYLIVWLQQCVTELLSQQLSDSALNFDGTALEISKQNGVEKLEVLIADRRLALTLSNNGSNPEMSSLKVWDGKSQETGLLETARLWSSS